MAVGMVDIDCGQETQRKAPTGFRPALESSLVALLERLVADIGAIEVVERTAGGWAALALVAGVVFGAAVRGFAWA